ncbi:hypothetical protein [Ruminococcus sp.]|uniref:hypothetical protein n=1 Tax=Ruminococcus sp. TaxID=41978 RepID=UPI0025D5D259|nr:hypothetical protein [Ruminococcus sp.]MBQ8966266.1 hypothetical protein [Ruminococcus sp.]
MKKICMLMIVLSVCFSVFVIPASAEGAVLKGSSFDNYTDFSQGPPSVSVPEGYVYAGYRVEQVNNLYSTVSNLYVQKTKEPMTLDYSSSNSGYVISIPNGVYYWNWITYDKNGVRSSNDTVTQKNSSNFAVSSNMAFYPAIPLVNSDTGHIIEPEKVSHSGLFHLHSFVDDKGVINLSVSTEYPGSCNVTYYACDISQWNEFITLNEVSKTLSQYVLGSLVTFDNLDDTSWYERYFQKYSEKVIKNFKSGYEIGQDIGEGELESMWIVPYSQDSKILPRGSFNRSDSSAVGSNDDYPSLPSPRAFVGSGVVSSSSSAEASLSVPTFMSYAADYGGVYSSRDLVIFAIVQVPDGDSIEYVILGDEFDLGAIYSNQFIKNGIVAPIIAPQLPDPDNYGESSGGTINSLDDLARYLKYLFDNLTENVSIIANNQAINIRNQIASINWHSLIGTGFHDFSLSDIIDSFRDLFEVIEIDTDYDLSSLASTLAPLLPDASNSFSLPDLTTALAPVMNSLDIAPNGEFALHLDSLFDDINGQYELALGDINTELGDLKGELSASVTDLSNEIDLTVKNTFLPDVEVISDRLELSDDRLKSKFSFVRDVSDGLGEIRNTIEDSETSPPDWKFTVFGKTMTFVDWSAYDTYRSKIHGVFVAVAYVLLARYIIKTLPSAIGDENA